MHAKCRITSILSAESPLSALNLLLPPNPLSLSLSLSVCLFLFLSLSPLALPPLALLSVH